MLGINDDSKNYRTQAFLLTNASEQSETPPTVALLFFVDITRGEIVFIENQIRDALNREIVNWNNRDPQGNPQIRREGDPPLNDIESNDAYNFLGRIYTYFKDKHNRDSYDNNGGKIFAETHLDNITPRGFYPQAAYQQHNNQTRLGFCNTMVALDIAAHEYTHAVTSHTARLINYAQSGAISESMSDIFAFALDNNLTLGENSGPGIIRHMDDPPLKNQPDRLISQHYNCRLDRDNGGVHINNGVPNKAFYLMTFGGRFNVYDISPIGSFQSLPLMYRVLTTYLQPSDNFKSLYTAAMTACNDLFSGGVCEQVDKSFQATLMHAQPDGLQRPMWCEPDPPPPTGTPTPTPTGHLFQPPISVDVKANNSNGPITVAPNTNVIISWISTAATRCEALDDLPRTSIGLSGSGNVTERSDRTTRRYTVRCYNAAGSSASDSVSVRYENTAPPLRPDLKVNGSNGPITVRRNAAFTVSWSSPPTRNNFPCSVPVGSPVSTHWNDRTILPVPSGSLVTSIDSTGNYSLRMECSYEPFPTRGEDLVQVNVTN